MSVPDLVTHPDRNFWIYRALTILQGENMGEKLAAQLAEQRAKMKQ